MSTFKSKPNMIVFAAFLAFAMSGCGKSNNNAAAPLPPGGYPGGYPQNNIPGGYPGAGAPLQSGCTNIQGPISFQGSMVIDSANVYAGVGVTAPAPTGYGYQQPQGYGQISMQGSGSDGWMTIQATMTGATTANAVGQIQLSQMVVQQIMMQSQMMGLPYGQAPCAMVVGINIGHYNTTLYGGGFGGGRAVRLMLNNTIEYFLYF